MVNQYMGVAPSTFQVVHSPHATLMQRWVEIRRFPQKKRNAISNAHLWALSHRRVAWPQVFFLGFVKCPTVQSRGFYSTEIQSWKLVVLLSALVRLQIESKIHQLYHIYLLTLYFTSTWTYVHLVFWYWILTRKYMFLISILTWTYVYI